MTQQEVDALIIKAFQQAIREIGERMDNNCICIIPATGPVRFEPFTDDGVDEIYAALGTTEIDRTLIDATTEWGLHAWVGDDSMSDGSPINRRATDARNQVRKDYGQGPHPYPLCGTVVLMAFNRHSGENIDLPRAWWHDIGPTGRFKWTTHATASEE